MSALQEQEDISSKRIGIANRPDLYDEDYDFDEMNPEIPKMFEEAE